MQAGALAQAIVSMNVKKMRETAFSRYQLVPSPLLLPEGSLPFVLHLCLVLSSFGSCYEYISQRSLSSAEAHRRSEIMSSMKAEASRASAGTDELGSAPGTPFLMAVVNGQYDLCDWLLDHKNGSDDTTVGR